MSNAQEFWFRAESWFDLNFEQFKGMVDMWSQCQEYSKWIKDNSDSFEVRFCLLGEYNDNQAGHTETIQTHTIPEFIAKYIGRRGEDLFYGMLLGEL